MASAMIVPDENFPSLKIRNIRASTNPRLDNCSSGFDKNIVTFGFKLSRKHEGFFIVFTNQATRTNYLKNSKWLKSLKRLHISPGFDSINVLIIEYNIEQGLIIPILDLVFIPKDFRYHQDFVDQEDIILAYASSNTPADWGMAVKLSKAWVAQIDCIPYSCINNPNTVCNGHIGNAVLLQKVANMCSDIGIILFKLALSNINVCQSMPSKVVLVKLLLNFPVNDTKKAKKRKLQASNIVADMCCSSFEELMTGKLINKQEFLANHAFNLACICYEMEEYKAAEDHIVNIQILTEAESLKSFPDKQMMRIREANAILERLIKSQLTTTEQIKEEPVVSTVSKLENLSLNQQTFNPPDKDIIRIGDIIKVSSDFEMKIDVFGRGVLNIDIKDNVEVYSTDGDLLQSLKHVESVKHFATINFDQEFGIKQVFIQEKDQFEAEIDTVSKVNKVVTFNPKDDIFGQSDADDDSLKEDFYPEIMSSAVCSNIITAGVSEVEKILNDIEEYILTQLEKKYNRESVSKFKELGKKSQSNLKELRKLANTMTDSWRAKKEWLEEFWDSCICNSFDHSNGRYIQPRDVNLDQIKEELAKNFNYKLSFNKWQFLNFSAEFMAEASVKYLKKKQLERENPNTCDDELTKSFKLFWAEEMDTNLSYDDVQEIMDRNHVTIKFLKQGYECSLSNFGSYVIENLNKLEENQASFILIFKNFFEHEKTKTAKRYIPPFTSAPKIDDLNDSIVDIEDDDASYEEESAVQVLNEDCPSHIFTETEVKVQPYLTNLLEDITNNLQNQSKIESDTYHANIKEYLRRGQLLSEELKGTGLLTDLSPVLDTLKSTLSKHTNNCIEKDGMKSAPTPMLPSSFRNSLESSTSEESREDQSQTQSKESQNLDTNKSSANDEVFKVLGDIFKLQDELSIIIEENVLVNIEEYERKVKKLSIELKKTPQGSGPHFRVNIKQLQDKLRELKTKQSDFSPINIQTESGRALKQLDLNTTNTSTNNEKEMVTKLKQENEQCRSNLESYQRETNEQSLTISVLKTENFNLKLQEKELSETINYIRKNQDSSLLKALEKNSELESKNVKLEKDNGELRKKMEEMEKKLKDMEKEHILLEYKLLKGQAPKRLPENVEIPTNSQIKSQARRYAEDTEQTEQKIKLLVPGKKTRQVLYFKPDTDNLIPFSMVEECNPETTAIKYKLAVGNWRMLILENGYFHPPEDGWRDREYEIVNKSKKPSPPPVTAEPINTQLTRLQSTHPVGESPATPSSRPIIPQTPSGRTFIPPIPSRHILPLMPHNPYVPHPYANPLYSNSLHQNFYGYYE
eukprot:GFUD01002764.1.p1 GENE.GFUD01002764.1~~GFUD01002764.1.p1  ORF type:complete len:1314 (+),score=298.67 GFUD01002764.1:229-4170(+)